MNGRNMPILKNRKRFSIWMKIKYLLEFIGDFYEEKREYEYMETHMGRNKMLKRYDRL